MNAKSAAPVRKVSAGGLAGAVTLLVIWLLGSVHVTVTPEVASALTLVIATAVAYLIPASADEATPAPAP